MWLAALALFVVSLGFGIILPLLPDVTGGSGAIAVQFSAVFVGYSAARIATQLPGGPWIDRTGAVFVLRVALVAYALSLAGFLVDWGFAWFVTVRVVEGAATGLTYPAVLALAASGDEAHIGRRVGTATGVGASGIVVGPVIAGLLAPIDVRLPIVVGLGATAVLAVAFFFVKNETPTVAPRNVLEEARALGRLFTDRRFLGLSLPLSFNKLTFSGFQALLPLWGAEVLGLGIRGITGLFALSGLLFAALQPPVGRLADRMNARTLMGACAVLLLPTVACLGLTKNAWLFTAGYALYIVLTSSIFAATMKHAGKEHGKEHGHGSVYGLISSATDLMTLLGPLLFLVLYQTSRDLLFPVVGGVGILFAAGFFRLR